MRSYAYICSLGAEGLREASEIAVLNANYLLALLQRAGVGEYLPLAFGERCMHEFVLSGAPMKRDLGIRTTDLAKRLLDFGYHPPTVYFPLLVEEALLVEPTETETRETLEAFAEAVGGDPARGGRRPGDRPQRALHAPRCGAWTRPPRRASPVVRQPRRRRVGAGALPDARVVVLGGGPAGDVAALRAAQLGRRAPCWSERDLLAGTCVNRGCIPTKALLAGSELVARLREASDGASPWARSA